MSTIYEPAGYVASAGGGWWLGRNRLAEALSAKPAHTHDVGWGNGIAYRVGYDPDTTSRLAVVPDSGVARITDQDIQIILFHQWPPPLYASSSSALRANSS